jgi:general stress protein 26
MTTIHPTYRTRHGLTGAAVEVLELGQYTILGTENPDGSAHVVPVMYLFDEGRVYIETSAATRKARNVGARPRATILVQDPRADGQAWVSGCGPAEILHGEQAQQLGHRIRARYFTEVGEEQVGTVMARYDGRRRDRHQPEEVDGVGHGRLQRHPRSTASPSTMPMSGSAHPSLRRDHGVVQSCPM